MIIFLSFNILPLNTLLNKSETKKKNLLNEIDRQLIELQHNIPQGNEENTIAMGQNNLTLIGTAENQIIIPNTEPISNSNEESENMTLISDVRNQESVTEQNQMKKDLTELWKKNFRKYIELDIDQCECSMKVPHCQHKAN